MAGGNSTLIANFYDLLIYWVIAMVCAFIGKPIKCPPLLLYLIFGALAGNLGWVDYEREGMTFFAEFSITLVFVALGLEESVEHFIEGIRLSWGIALIGALVPFACGYLCAVIFWMEYGWTLHITIATAVTATAVSLTMMILQGLNLLKTKSAVGIMSSAVLDDVGCLILVSILIPVVVAASPAAAATDQIVPFDTISVSFIANSSNFNSIGTDQSLIARAEHLIAADISNVTNMSTVNLEWQRVNFTSDAAVITFTNSLPISCRVFDENRFESLLSTSSWLYLLGDTYGPFTAYSTSESAHYIENKKIKGEPEVKESLSGGDIAWIIGKVLIFLLIVVFLHVVVLPDHVTEGWVSYIPIVRTYGIRHVLSFSEGDQVPLIVVTFALALGMLGVSFGFHPAIGGYFAGLLLDEKYFDVIRDGDDGSDMKELDEDKIPVSKRPSRIASELRQARSNNGTARNKEDGEQPQPPPIKKQQQNTGRNSSIIASPARSKNANNKNETTPDPKQQQQAAGTNDTNAEEMKEKNPTNKTGISDLDKSIGPRSTGKQQQQSVKSKLNALKSSVKQQPQQNTTTTDENNNTSTEQTTAPTTTEEANTTGTVCTEKNVHSKKRRAENNEEKGRDNVMNLYLAANEEEMADAVLKDDGDFDRVVAEKKKLNGGDLDTAKSFESYYPETPPFDEDGDGVIDEEDELLAAMDEAAEHAANNTMERTREAVATAAFMWLGPVFFVHLGAGFEVRGDLLATAVPQALAITAILYVGQFISATLSARYVPGGYTWAESALIGFGMLGRAELYFVVLNEAKNQKVIPNEVYFPMALAALFMNISLSISMVAFQGTYLKYETWEPAAEEDEEGKPKQPKTPRQFGIAPSKPGTVVSSRGSRISRISRLSKLTHIARRGVGVRGVVQEREAGVGVTNIEPLPIESRNMALIRSGFGYEIVNEETGEVINKDDKGVSDRKSVLGQIRAARQQSYATAMQELDRQDAAAREQQEGTSGALDDSVNVNNLNDSRNPSAPRQGSGYRRPSSVLGLKALRLKARAKATADDDEEDADAAGDENNNRVAGNRQSSTGRRGSSRPPSAIGVRFHRPSNFLQRQSSNQRSGSVPRNIQASSPEGATTASNNNNNNNSTTNNEPTEE